MSSKQYLCVSMAPVKQLLRLNPVISDSLRHDSIYWIMEI
jgi:hypothetical protein